jgi:hypothetical protein
MNDRVQIVENKLRENGIKVDRIDNSCKLQTGQITKVESSIKKENRFD